MLKIRGIATRAMASELISAVESFTIDSMIRGYHVYKDVWSSFIGEMLYCRRDVRNHHDPFAAAVCKGTTVVGHMPRKISAACYVFLGKAGATITGKVTGSRRYSHDLPQGGMEIPWVMKFAGDKVLVNKVMSLLIDTRRPLPSSAPVPVRVCNGTDPSDISNSTNNEEPEQPKGAKILVEDLPDTKVEAVTQEFESVHDEGITDPIASKKVLECEPPCHDEPSIDGRNSSSKRHKYDVEACLSMVLLDPVESGGGNKDAVKHQGSASISASSSTWVKFGRVSLTLSDRDEIAGGFQLNDKQINYTKTY